MVESHGSRAVPASAPRRSAWWLRVDVALRPGIGGDSQNIEFRTPQGEVRGFVRTGADGTVGIALMDPKGERSLIELDVLRSGGIQIALRDTSGVTRLQLQLDSKAGPSIRLFDSHGEITWRAP